MTYRHSTLTGETAAMLKAARAAKAWTLHKAADEIGCNYTHVWRLENAKAAPSTALAVDVIYAYGLNQDQARLLMAESVSGAGRDRHKAGRRMQHD